MIDYKEAAAIAAKYNAKLKELTTAFDAEMSEAFGERYLWHRKYYVDECVPAIRANDSEVEAAAKYIFDVRERKGETCYLASIDGTEIWLNVTDGGEDYDYDE